MTLDQYLRAGLDELVNDVLRAAERWRRNASTKRTMQLRGAIDNLAEAYVAFDELVDEYKKSDGTPADLNRTKRGIR